MSNFGLSAEILQSIIKVFENHSPIEKVIIYGSRAKGNFKTGSDIDITLEGSELSNDILIQIIGELDELILPYKFDVSLRKQITQQDLQQHITRVGKIIYERKG